MAANFAKLPGLRFHMIKTEIISDNVLRITAPAKLEG